MNKTIIYYTSNHEDPIFEQKIIDDMLSKKGNLPVISVSQKPMDLGHNIGVGEVGQSYINEWRQIIMGAKQATTEYLIMAESDVLYAPEYFQFEPKDENIYRYDNVWVMWSEDKIKNFHRKHYSEGCQIVKRDYFIDLLEDYLKDYPDWYGESYKNRNRHAPYSKASYVFFHGKTPCVSIKTRNGCTFYTSTNGGAENISKKLRYWGDINKLRERFL